MRRQNVVAIFLGLMAIAATAIACSGQVQKNGGVAQSDRQLVDTGSFTVLLPPGWQFNKLRGVDSQIGEFVGDGITLTFEFGWYSNQFVDDNDPSHTVNYETIDGHRAKLVTLKTDGTITGVYFSNLDNQNKLNISGKNLTPAQQETALAIFRTIQFKSE